MQQVVCNEEEEDSSLLALLKSKRYVFISNHHVFKNEWKLTVTHHLRPRSDSSSSSSLSDAGICRLICKIMHYSN